MTKEILGDCLEEMDKLIKQGVKVDAIITDPPYGITACKWDSVIPFEPMWSRLNKLIKPKGAIVLFGSEPFSSYLRMSNIKNFKYDWIWEKPKGSNFVHANYQPLKVHEIISVFSLVGSAQGSKQPMNYNPQYTSGKPYNKGIGMPLIPMLSGGMSKARTIELKNETGNRSPRTIQYFKTAESESKYHPTQKPVKLLEYLIKTYTKENETVLDFTSGSFTTTIASINTNRNCIGIEKDLEIFKIGKERVDNHKVNLQKEIKNKENLKKFF